MADEPSVQLPALGLVADTHAHLDMLDDPVAALVNAARAGVTFIATVADVTEDAERTFDSLGTWRAAAADILAPDGPQVPEVHIVVGAHPHNARLFDDAVADRIRALAQDPRVVAIGEAGLDFHYENSPRTDQHRAFRGALDIAHDLGLPIVVHLREAHEEGIQILAEKGVPTAGCIIHCFTEDAPLAARFVEMGCHISFAGPVTFKKATVIREAAALIPLDRMLVETDCPFLTPEPYRGRRNEPALVTVTAQAVAAVRAEPLEDVMSALHENALVLLGDEERIR